MSSRFMWVRVKIVRERSVFISENGPGSDWSEKVIERFWSELSECVGSFGRNESLVELGDLNARVGNEVIEGIVGHHGIPGRNESQQTITGDVCRAGVSGGSQLVQEKISAFSTRL